MLRKNFRTSFIAINTIIVWAIYAGAYGCREISFFARPITPPAQYVTSPSTAQMQFASNPNLSDVKRGIMIDRLTTDDAEPGLVKKLLNLYKETESIEVKTKIIQNLMMYDQDHTDDKAYINNDKLLLRAFFADLLNSQSLNSKMANNALRGFIDTHTPEEILNNRDKFDKLLSTTSHYSSIMLKYSLIDLSKELQNIYVKSIITELREADNSDLDSYLFGPLSIGYQNLGKNFLDPESRQVVLDYLKEVRYKYTDQGIKANSNDMHRSTTAPSYFELIRNMGVTLEQQ